MLLPRQLQLQSNIGKLLAKNFNESGLEVKPIYNKMSQHSHVNKLLSTAASGNAVLDDVEGLLTPIRVVKNARQQEQPSPQDSGLTRERTERNLWRNDEVLEMMFVMQEIKALEKLNDKQMKSENVFKEVEVIMHKNGFVKKSHLQIWTKWKFLKSTYMTSRRNGVVPRMIPPEIYSELHQMISGASDYDTSTNGSTNGDYLNGSTSIVLSNSDADRDKLPNIEDGEKLEVSHPIFGYQLGLVKNEPIDNGYDAVENSNTEGEKCQTDDMSSPPVNVIMKHKEPKEKEEDRAVVVPHRGRGRPPKVLSWETTSTTAPTPTAIVASAQLPPLRVAPYAKVSNATNTLALNRPPPPLTMSPSSRPIRVTDITNFNNKGDLQKVKLIQPKLKPKPQTHPQSVHIVRLQTEVNTRSGRASASPSPSYPKMKQVPMRKTPYSLRPDRAIPDLNESLSPPPERRRKLEEVPSTSHLILQSSSSNASHENGNPVKRRIDQQTSHSTQTKTRKLPWDDEEQDITDNDSNQQEAKMYRQLMKSASVVLSESLRKTQTQMIKEFFKRQHELLEREHAFQIQQDRLIIETFNLQTQEIMNSVRDLVDTIASDSKEQQTKSHSGKMNAKTQRDHDRPIENLSFAIEDSLQEMPEQYFNGHFTELEQENDADDIYIDEEEPNDNNVDDEVDNIFQTSDHIEQVESVHDELTDHATSHLVEMHSQNESNIKEKVDRDGADDAYNENGNVVSEDIESHDEEESGKTPQIINGVDMDRYQTSLESSQE